MTIEERAIKASKKLSKTYKCYDDGNDKDGVCYFTTSKKECIDAYVKGATEQKAIDIDKACAYFLKNECSMVFIDNFLKAMEQ